VIPVLEVPAAPLLLVLVPVVELELPVLRLLPLVAWKSCQGTAISRPEVPAVALPSVPPALEDLDWSRPPLVAEVPEAGCWLRVAPMPGL
jgi:hypothetical protein